ncbi:MAG TPA: hypothetical protein VFZ09_05445 [Archangium sp.]|uniref:hypothetical protein n=1 Tax=Archangium sp. TaxID=1872627 RepID=UPI002E36CAC7|nr:hypothetical protein [Archangium sp.]HEX5745665.1 hypothetical protein [Archangium sp.]
MSKVNSIDSMYRQYLETRFAPGAVASLIGVLHQADLTDEAKALKAYFEGGPGVIYTAQKTPWLGRKCFVGAVLPGTAKPGDLWFDIVEMAMMVLVPGNNKADPKKWFWLSTHPAYLWQFKGFAALSRWRLRQQHFLKAKDLMSTDARFASVQETEFVSDVYHEEAVAYARWFGKFLCSQHVLQLAKEFLPRECFDSVLPKGVRFWSETEFVDSQFVRIATGQDTLEKEPDDEFALRESKENEKLADRMLYEEWERRVEVGVSTFVPLQVGLVQKSPARVYEFMELEALAPRPG